MMWAWIVTLRSEQIRLIKCSYPNPLLVIKIVCI